MSRFTVVGSGASGVHFALTLLQKGHDVVMLDVGNEKPEVVSAEHTFDEMKTELADPAEYFLGRDFEAVTFPGHPGEIYAFPPSKRYVFSSASEYQARSSGIEPYASFAQGGLAEAWTGGVYPFNDYELADFPFSYAELGPYYDQVAGRIGVNGAEDDLSRFYPVHENLLAPLELDEHSRVLLGTYARKRDYLNHRLQCHFGYSRVSTLSRPRPGRAACSYCGRCMWGCPTDAFYTPSITLRDCLRYPNFEYHGGAYVRYFRYDAAGRITTVVVSKAGSEVEYPVERLALAAGTLSSARIFLESIHRATGQLLRLNGLMDNRQILVPFLNLRLIGGRCEPRTYQYHQVAMGLQDESGDPKAYVHGQVTTLTTGLVHPVIENLPLNLRSARRFFRNVRAALGVVNLNLHDDRRPENYVTVEPTNGASGYRLVVHYQPAPSESARIKRVLTRTRKALLRLGCVIPPGMVHVRPMGASVHYSGTLPMSTKREPYTVSPACQSHDFSNLLLADGSSFPFLPAKNLTFTLMANATRVADLAC